METMVRVLTTQLRPAPSREQRALQALQRGDQLVAQAILNGVEDSEETDLVTVVCNSDTLSVSFTVPVEEAPHVGDEYIVTLSKRPALGGKVLDLA
jgi:hypothetical protein